MSLMFELAADGDAPALAALHSAVGERLTGIFGRAEDRHVPLIYFEMTL